MLVDPLVVLVSIFLRLSQTSHLLAYSLLPNLFSVLHVRVHGSVHTFRRLKIDSKPLRPPTEDSNSDLEVMVQYGHISE